MGKRCLIFSVILFAIRETAGHPYEAELCVDTEDAIYGRPIGGITPSGWYSDQLPYLVEVDNWGSSGRGGESIGGIWVWGWDEICWFARLQECERNAWLSYAWDWVRRNTVNGHLQIPTRRILADAVDTSVWWYYANRPSPVCENGFNQEDHIKAIWKNDL